MYQDSTTVPMRLEGTKSPMLRVRLEEPCIIVNEETRELFIMNYVAVLTAYSIVVTGAIASIAVVESTGDKFEPLAAHLSTATQFEFCGDAVSGTEAAEMCSAAPDTGAFATVAKQ